MASKRRTIKLWRKNRIIKRTGMPRIMSNSIVPRVQKAKILFIIFRSFPSFFWGDFFRFQPGIDVSPVEFNIFGAYPHIRRAITAGDVLVNRTFRIAQISRQSYGASATTTSDCPSWRGHAATGLYSYEMIDLT